MTRRSLNRTLSRAYFWLGLVLAVSLAAKLSTHVPGFTGTQPQLILASVYDYLKDMALVFVTVVAAYLANVFQKRSKFVESLEEEWRGIVRTKCALQAYCAKPYPSTDEYLGVFSRLSESIDSMRIVYKNVGETNKRIGLYPYEPLHDMRRALQAIDPRSKPSTTEQERMTAYEAVQQAFDALRENFLDELDLEQPSKPIVVRGARRLKANDGH